jgi:hypothetical protein
MADPGDLIELIVDVPEHNLRAGLRAAIVHQHTPEAYEVEIANECGETEDLLPLKAEQFIVVWRSETHEWVPLAEQVSELMSRLPEESGREVLDFARFLALRRRRSMVVT